MEVRNCARVCPSNPTGAQVRSFDEIKADLQKAHPMHRLVQGRRRKREINFGRTHGCLRIRRRGRSAKTALMVPSRKFLAEQHFRNSQNF